MTASSSGSTSGREAHYEWITDYLASRGLTGAVRLMMSLISASLTACLVALITSVDGPRGHLPVAMMAVALCGGVAGSILWAWRWPTQRQSLAYALVSNTSVALACMSYPSPQGALTGCIAFATMGAYIAFFHSTALVLYNFGLAALVAVIAAVRVAASGHLELAAVDLFLIAQVNIAMPLAIHVLVRALGVDLERADRDPLTGLLNRRSFHHHTEKMLAAAADPMSYLTVALIDLDDFKRINDTHGHQAGDDALVAVSRALGQAVTKVPAVLARSGGEEFIVAALGMTPDATLLARRVCEAIADLPVSITASVGTASTDVRALRRDADPLAVGIARLVVAADDAMYSAKRAGGNRYHHSGRQER